MKRFFLVALAMVLLLTSVSTVSATSVKISDKSDAAEIDVTAKYQSATTTPAVYSVDISWSNMTFTYTETGTKTWNALTHTYETNTTQGAWDKTSATITVTNHSNVSVDVTLTPTITPNLGINATLSNPSATLDAGTEGNYTGADSHTSTLTIKGTPNSAITSDGVKIGTIKVTIE